MLWGASRIKTEGRLTAPYRDVEEAAQVSRLEKRTVVARAR